MSFRGAGKRTGLQFALFVTHEDICKAEIHQVSTSQKTDM